MDSEREKFRTYIEKSGVMSALTDVLVHLYEEPERPSDALQYIKKALGTIATDTQRLIMFEEKVKEQQQTIEAQRATIESLQAEVTALKEKVGEVKDKDEVEKPAATEDATQA